LERLVRVGGRRIARHVAIAGLRGVCVPIAAAAPTLFAALLAVVFASVAFLPRNDRGTRKIGSNQTIITGGLQFLIVQPLSAAPKEAVLYDVSIGQYPTVPAIAMNAGIMDVTAWEADSLIRLRSGEAQQREAKRQKLI
jgi:hypothetical protein